ncbi:hypothetical protein [Endozoicomonas sp.]|uniref:hypothetical protein n=1 Tax=Endozoicomonas sp. TaxID=1892382 RepID=UPI0028889C9D|nr:hypothetical protein [Endozoicomonas sp.]
MKANTVLALLIVLGLSGTTISTTAMGAKTRDNVVEFVLWGFNHNETLENISYEVTDHIESQPETFKGIVAIIPDDTTAMIVVRAGRKESYAAANQFVDWGASASHNIYNHPPKTLNFAVIGNLTFTIEHPRTGQKTEYYLPDFVIAQGRAGFANNWWAGSRHCDFTGNDTNNFMDCKSGLTFWRPAFQYNRFLILPAG